MKVLLDTNVILDFFLEREPFQEEACRLFEAIAEERVFGFVSASSVTDIFYICRKQRQSFDDAREILTMLLKLCEICPVDSSVLTMALSSGLSDFEDAVQIACAEMQGVDAIITRNQSDFQSSPVDVLAPDQLLQIL